MAHVRQQIREYVAAQLAAVPGAGANVYQSRTYRFNTPDIPALNVWTNAENSEPDTMESDDSGLARDCDLVVEGYVKATADVDDAMDDIALEVERILGADRSLGNLAYDCVLVQSEPEFNGEAEQMIGCITMTFRVQYGTTTSVPDVPL